MVLCDGRSRVGFWSEMGLNQVLVYAGTLEFALNLTLGPTATLNRRSPPSHKFFFQSIKLFNPKKNPHSGHSLDNSYTPLLFSHFTYNQAQDLTSEAIHPTPQPTLNHTCTHSKCPLPTLKLFPWQTPSSPTRYVWCAFQRWSNRKRSKLMSRSWI